ncbi:MAG: phospholipase D family protein [Allosphingosinicella sp.]|uniref:phospholipase D family protein n=1 Tax=Allosphingosinicella sp. TaxID=2823234 RepID=UPI0039514BD2
MHLLPGAHEAFAARAALARAAKRSIDAQYYIWHADLTGSLLFGELFAAAERGVRVRLLLDDHNTPGLDPIVAALDAHPNIEVRLFNPFRIRKPRLLGFLTDFRRLNRRMHNKSFTVDGEATIVGGRNVGDEYFGAGEGALFVDLDVLAVGPVVEEVSNDFERYWTSAPAHPTSKVVAPLRAGQPDEVRSRLAAKANDPKALAYMAAVGDLPQSGQLPFEWAPVRMVSDNPVKVLGRARRRELILRKMVATMGEPRRRIDLVSGYFVPTRSGTRSLTALARRGIEVNILTNALEATDVPIVHAGYAKWRRKLLRAGVRIFELRRPDAAARPPRPARSRPGSGSAASRLGGAGSALHAKTFLVDGERLFVGSFNFDPRSANLNTELGFVIASPALAEGIQSDLQRLAPARAYEVRLSPEDRLYWVERRDGGNVRHDIEPGASRWRRLAVRFLSRLPIEWLL